MAHPRRFRFGVQTHNATTGEEWAQTARRAEDLGYSTMFMPDHFGDQLAPVPALMAAAVATTTLRVGSLVFDNDYKHPLVLAKEMATIDRLSGGRLEVGIGKGAYQREFDRLAGGIDQNIGVPMMLEMLPALLALWQGDYEHNGKYWSFPAATSCPKPLQKPHPPIWVAARDPGTFNAAVKQGYDIMTWPLTRPFSEFEDYMARFESALAASPGVKRPRFMTMRHVGVWDDASGSDVFIEAIRRQGRQFENLRLNLAPVIDGFPQEPDLDKLSVQAEYQPEVLMQNLVLGTPDEVIRKLKPYEAKGLDYFCYNAAYGLPIAQQQRSLELFIKEVVPAFRTSREAKAAIA